MYLSKLCLPKSKKIIFSYTRIKRILTFSQSYDTPITYRSLFAWYYLKISDIKIYGRYKRFIVKGFTLRSSAAWKIIFYSQSICAPIIIDSSFYPPPTASNLSSLYMKQSLDVVHVCVIMIPYFYTADNSTNDTLNLNKKDSPVP